MLDLHDFAVELAIEVVLVVIGDDSQNFPRVIDAVEAMTFCGHTLKQRPQPMQVSPLMSVR